MIKYLRKGRVQRSIYIVIAIAVTVSFVVFGIKTGDEKSAPTSIGSIDNQNISVIDVMKSYKAVQHEMLLMYGEKFQQVQSFINLKGEALDRLALLYYAKKNNIKASDDEVLDWVARQPIFLRDKQFDTEIYKRYVAQFMGNNSNDVSISTREFEEEIRQMITLSKLRKSIRAHHTVTDEELRAFYNQENGERDIAYTLLNSESLISTLQITDEEVEKIYPSVKGQFRTPEKVSITYLFVPAEKSDSLKAIFDEPSSLEELSKKYALEIKETGFFEKNTAIPEIGLVKSILDRSFSLKEGQESEWIHEEKGSYKIKVKEKSSALLSETESKQKVKEILTRQKAGEAAAAKLELVKTTGEGSSFEKAVRDSGLEYKTIEKFKKGSYIQGIGPSDGMESLLADLKQGQISTPFKTANGAALITALKDYPADEKKFAEEKENYKETILNRKASEELEKVLGDLRSKMKLDNELMKNLFPEENR